MMVAFLGLGDMGLPMALNLQRKGYSVTGWNRTPGARDALAELGGRLAATAAEAVAGAEVVLTMLGGPASVAAVAGAFLPACRPGALWIDSSTIGPEAAVAMAALAARHGIAFVDAPVTGSVPQAQEGTLNFLAGGAEADVRRAEPVLLAMGRRLYEFGPVGQGAAAKAVNNQMVGVQVAALAEAVVLAEELGLDRAQFIDFVSEGAAGSPAVKGKGALMKSGEFPPAFRLKWMEKDVALGLKEATDRGISLPVAAGALALLSAARAGGYADADVAAVVAYLRQVAAGRPDAPVLTQAD